MKRFLRLPANGSWTKEQPPIPHPEIHAINPDATAEQFFFSAAALSLRPEGFTVEYPTTITYWAIIKGKWQGTNPDGIFRAGGNAKRVACEILGSEHFNSSKKKQLAVMKDVIKKDKNVEYVQFSKPILEHLDLCLEIIRQLAYGKIDTLKAVDWVRYLLANPDEMTRYDAV